MPESIPAIFEISSPTKVSLTQTGIEFSLTDTDVEILKRNIETNEKYFVALLQQLQNDTQAPLFHWNWRYPRITKLRS